MRCARWKPWSGTEGHFYNWYDTQSLKPLTPVYISTVDSGNLAGHLLTLAPGLLALPDDRILGGRALEGLRDTLAILLDATGGAARARLAPLQKELESACGFPPTTLAAARMCLDRFASAAAELAGNPADRSRERSNVVGAGAGPAMPERTSMTCCFWLHGWTFRPRRPGSGDCRGDSGDPDVARTGTARGGIVSDRRACSRRASHSRANRLAVGASAARHARQRPRPREDRGD